MKRIWKYSLLMAGVLAAAAAIQQLSQEGSNGIFYRVSGGKNEMVLLGSIHVGSRDMYPMGDAIQQALKQAEVLVFECDTSSPEAQAQTAQMMAGVQPLSAVVSEACYEQIVKAAGELGYPMASFEKLKPWAVTSTLTVAAAAREMEAGSRRTASALGVENMVRRLAGEKQTIWLESAVGQLELMESFSPALQEYLLTSACQAVLDPENGSGADENVDRWPEWWKAGDAQAFAASYTSGLSKEAAPELAAEYHQKLMTGRNIRMAEKLDELLQSDGPDSYFVTVGLMHLVLPEDSIIAHLKQMGYTVEQIIP